jgi:hypothetical protein
MVATFVGSLQTSSGQVSIADNGTDAVIVDGSYGYVVNLTTYAFSQISSASFYGADIVDYLDDYFIFNRPNTEQFYISGIGATTFDALDFASAEGNPDMLVSLIVDHRELWLFGAESTDVFYNSGNVDFPIERQNTTLEHGCAAKFSVAKIDNTVFWLGKDKLGQGTVWRAQGYTPVRIGTHALEFAIGGYSDISDAIAYTYQQEGHSFYVLTFPTANKTWVYDASTNLWHERAYLKPSDGSMNRHRSNCHIFYNNLHMVGDWENGKIYALDMDYYSDNGDPMPAIRTGGHVTNPDALFMFWGELEVFLESGIGLQTGQGSAPIVQLDWSDDGGHTWSNRHNASMGAVGNYQTRARWQRLGRSRDRIPRITISDPVKRVIIGAKLKYKLGRN